MKFDSLSPAGLDRALQVAVWREACRHIEIQESTHTIAGILGKREPIGQLLVRRIDRQRACLETVAVGVPMPDYLLPEARTTCDEDQLDRVLAWCGKREVLHADQSRGCRDLLAAIIPSGLMGDAVAGPLGDAENPSGGVVVLLAQTGVDFDDSHVRLVEALLEPFSVALENDRRLREMAAMQAAAEADKESLLKRLGRKKIDSDCIVGENSGLQHVMERVALVARNDAPVLILGETGTGKELIARMIHTQSPRANGPFLRVNYGAIPAELIDSQLFGHEKGAFTGAVEARQGWFERANGGTLLLDEAGELPLAVQVRLLRILQDGWMDAWAAMNRCTSTFALWPPHIVTWRRW